MGSSSGSTAWFPEREAWLWENETAKGMVDRGLRQVREGELGDGPVAAAFAFAEGLPDDE